MISVFEYWDYRKFLKDYYTARKNDNPNFSHRFVASKVGLSSSTFTKVLQKKRNLSLRLATKFYKILKFTKKEMEYFNLLILFDQVKSQDEKKQYFEQLLVYHSSKAKTLQEAQYRYFEEWYYIAIRELLGICRFNGDYNDLSRKLQPNIKPKEAKKAILLLEQLSLIKKNRNGYYESCENHITTGDEWRSIAINNYQRSTIRLAEEAINRFPRELVDFSTLTMRLSKDGLSLVKNKIKQWRKELVELEGQFKDANSIYQINFNCFPLTKQ